MQDALRTRMFEEGDWVSVMGPMAESYPDMIGVVRSVSLRGAIYRYFVEFENGITETFFGFELHHGHRVSTHSA
jgi:hypothetical protein